MRANITWFFEQNRARSFNLKKALALVIGADLVVSSHWHSHNRNPQILNQAREGSFDLRKTGEYVFENGIMGSWNMAEVSSAAAILVGTKSAIVATECSINIRSHAYAKNRQLQQSLALPFQK